MFSVFDKYNITTKEPSSKLEDQYWENEGPFANEPFREDTGYFWLEAWKLMFQWEVELYQISKTQFAVDTDSGLAEVGTLKQIDNSAHLCLLEGFLGESGLTDDKQREQFVELIDKYAKDYKTKKDYEGFINDMVDGDLFDKILSEVSTKTESIDRRLMEMNEYYDDMSLDELPHSAYESLKDWFIGAGREDLENVGLPEDRIEYILNGGTPDYRDLELAYGGIVFVPGDFGWFESKSEVYNTVEESFDTFVDSMCDKYNTDYYDINTKTFEEFKNKLVELITETVFQNQ